MKSYTLQAETTLVTHECYKCHVLFAIPKNLDERAHQDQTVSFWCPNGHQAVYTETENMKLKHQLDQAEGRIATLRDQVDGALKEVTVKKREITRLKNRAKAGICPECNRTIRQASDHMRSCHMGQEEAAKVAEEHKAN